MEPRDPEEGSYPPGSETPERSPVYVRLAGRAIALGFATVLWLALRYFMPLITWEVTGMPPPEYNPSGAAVFESTLAFFTRSLDIGYAIVVAIIALSYFL
jgi:hypothetical protein